MTMCFQRLAAAPLMGIVTLMIGTSALVLAAQPAAAEPVRQMVVSTAGADLGTAGGRQLVRDRVFRAAKKVCAADGLHAIRSYNAQKRCVETAVSHSRMQLANIIASRPVYAAAGATRSPSVVSPEEEKSS
jgi:UrcA family protein